MTRFVGGPLDGWNYQSSKIEEAELPKTIRPTVKILKYQVDDLPQRYFALDKLNAGAKGFAGEYERGTDGRYYHQSHRQPELV